MNEILLNVDARSIPYFDQWCGVWAMEESAFNVQLALIQSMDIGLHLATTGSEVAASERGSSGLRYSQLLSDGIALMNIEGTLQKHVASMSGGTSTVRARRDLSILAADDSVRAVVMNIDSPGGTAAGTKEFGDAIRSFSKPIYAHITDLGASAAYWIASQADRITANEFALVGSIGTYAVVQDLSGMAAMQGIKVHVVKAGANKGAGVPGTEISAATLADMQRIIDSRNEMFLGAVASGRNMAIDRVRELADGRVHPAKESISMRLIDGIATLEQVVAEARQKVSLTTPRKGASRMSDTINAEQKPATVKEIKAACPDCSAEFIVACQESERTIEQCKDAYIQELATDVAARKEQEQVLQLQIAKGKATAGVAGLDTEASTGTAVANATEEWSEKLEANRAKYRDYAKAVSMTNRQNPGLREQMLAEVNAR